MAIAKCGTALSGIPEPSQRSTLNEWRERHGLDQVQLHTHEAQAVAVIGNVSNAAYKDLYWLSDYRVSSVSGGVVWLVKRN